MKAKIYFYSKGQSARARGWSKQMAEDYYLKGAADFARIYFDMGYRGLGL